MANCARIIYIDALIERSSQILCNSSRVEMRLQTVVGEFYSEVGYNFNFEKP